MRTQTDPDYKQTHREPHSGLLGEGYGWGRKGNALHLNVLSTAHYVVNENLRANRLN